MEHVHPVRWGILGCGNIANTFALGLQSTPGARLTAVASRDAARAAAFGERYGVSRRHDSYEALAADPEVDAVYIASRHPQHAENALLCLEAGKHVLVEKPFTMNGCQADQVAAAARTRGLLAVEAMWMRFIPLITRLPLLIEEMEIGPIRLITADFGFVCDYDPTHRLFDPALGGGALLDVGCYPMALATLVLGPAAEATGACHLGETGVDEHCAFTLRHACGGVSMLAAASRVQTAQQAILYGSRGTLRLPSPWWLRPTTAVITRPGRDDETIEVPVEGNGYQYQAIDFAACLREGRTQSKIMPLDETVANMHTLDRLRRQWGLAYPCDEAEVSVQR